MHWGPPEELYIQENGRAGRDGKMSYFTIYKSSDLNLHSTSKEMIDYCNNNSPCRHRMSLFPIMTSEKKIKLAPYLLVLEQKN